MCVCVCVCVYNKQWMHISDKNNTFDSTDC